MTRITIEDAMILLMIVAIVGVGLWMLVGSPSELQAIMAVAMFFGSAGLFVLKKTFSVENNFNKKLFKLDKNTSMRILKKQDVLNCLKEKLK